MKPANPLHPRAAFTLVELVATVAVIGVLTAMAIPIYSNVRSSSDQAVANDHVEALNRAVTNFSQTCWKLPTAADPSSTDDEYAVLRSIQYTFPAVEMKLGSPFFSPDYDPPVSSNSGHLRIRWNGRSFELLKFGESGTGLRFGTGADYKKTAYVFPYGYKPEGAN